MEFQIATDQSSTLEDQVVGFGLAVVSDEAVAVGVSAVPTPITEMASHLWFLHTILFADASNVAASVRPATRRSIDSKAMRKVEVGSDIIVVAEVPAGVSDGTEITVGGRMLVKNN